MMKSKLIALWGTCANILVVACLVVSCDDSGEASGSLGTSSGGGLSSDDIDLFPLDSSSMLVGNTSDGTMIQLSPESGAAFNFSNLDQFDEFAKLVGSVDITNDTIVSAADDNGVYGIDIDTGEVLWGAPLGRWKNYDSIDAPSAPVCIDSICYAMGNGGELVAFDAASQSTLWTNDLFPSAEGNLDVNPLLVTEEKIFAGAGRISGVFGDVPPQLFVVSRLTGEVELELEYGRPTLADNLLLIGGQPPGLRAYDLDTLQPIWSFSASIVSTPAVAGNVIAIHTSDVTVDQIRAQRVVGINRNDGSLLWVREAGTMQSFFAPVSDGNLIYSHFGETCNNPPCQQGYPRALNPADGSTIWENKDIDNIGLAPVVVEGNLLYDRISTFESGSGLRRGSASVNSADGSIEWVSMNGETRSSISAIIDGKAYRSSREPTFVPQ